MYDVENIMGKINGYRGSFGHSNYLIGHDVRYNQACYSEITYTREDTLTNLKKEFGETPIRILFKEGQLHERYTHELLNISAWKDMWITKDVKQGVEEGFIFDIDYFKPVRNMGLQCIRFPVEFERKNEIDRLWELVPDLTIQDMILLSGNLRFNGDSWSYQNPNSNHTPYCPSEVPLKSFLSGDFIWEEKKGYYSYNHFENCEIVDLRQLIGSNSHIGQVRNNFGNLIQVDVISESRLIGVIHELREMVNE